MQPDRKYALMLCSAVMTSCTTFQTTTLDEVRHARKAPTHLILTTTEGSRMKISEPSVTQDSIVGVAADRRAFVRLHNDQIRKIEARKFSWDRTGMGVILTGLIGAPLVSLVLLSMSGG